MLIKKNKKEKKMKMTPMTINYILLLVTGVNSLFIIISLIRGKGLGRKPFRQIAFIVVFILVLIATAEGIDYYTFRHMIESAL